MTDLSLFQIILGDQRDHRAHRYELPTSCPFCCGSHLSTSFPPVSFLFLPRETYSGFSWYFIEGGRERNLGTRLPTSVLSYTMLQNCSYFSWFPHFPPSLLLPPIDSPYPLPPRFYNRKWIELGVHIAADCRSIIFLTKKLIHIRCYMRDIPTFQMLCSRNKSL